jgi:hypothetical protein
MLDQAAAKAEAVLTNNAEALRVDAEAAEAAMTDRQRVIDDDVHRKWTEQTLLLLQQKQQHLRRRLALRVIQQEQQLEKGASLLLRKLKAAAAKQPEAATDVDRSAGSSGQAQNAAKDKKTLRAQYQKKLSGGQFASNP